MRVRIYTSGKNNHSRRIDNTTAGYRLDELTMVVDTQFSDLTVNFVCGVKHLSANNSKHILSSMKRKLLELILANFTWSEHSLAHMFDSTSFGNHLPQKTKPIALVACRTKFCFTLFEIVSDSTSTHLIYLFGNDHRALRHAPGSVATESCAPRLL
ncbi:MAG: hypothetical protein CMM01_08180 [Rhodopirellula sp.]|nr:hypothetical protein [Rhodopirellula sp.]